MSDGVLNTFERCGLSFKTRQAAQTLWDELEKRMIANECDMRFYDETHLDTMDRENLTSELSQMLIGEEWPCYGHSDEHKAEFYAAFKEAAIKRGITVTY